MPGDATSSSGSVAGSKPDAAPSADEQDLERLGPAVVAGAEGLVEAGQDRADESDHELGVLGAASDGEQSGGHPAGQGAGSSGTTTGPGAVRPEGSHGLCWSAGSVEATHVSLLVPSPRLEMTSESASGPHPGQPARQQAEATRPDPTAASSATANVRSTTGRATRAPSSPTVGIVDGARIS